jgi:hypothetical protein
MTSMYLAMITLIDRGSGKENTHAGITPMVARGDTLQEVVWMIAKRDHVTLDSGHNPSLPTLLTLREE